ncbi:MAG: LysE/ArgO family amino acid transporter [Gammaproteobacteria bacterium]|nr:LysE/ArgO family amino acid transporter [Gammaproteobacteria bacterium]
MSQSILVLLTGFSVSISLILAIGAQNAFVLRQGLKGQYVFSVTMICALSDALLIALGVFGFHWLLELLPGLDDIARYGGAAFLLVYGAMSFYSAWHQSHGLNPAHMQQQPSYRDTIILCLGFTWLNPHVYLDTLVLIGSVSSQFPQHLLAFASGAISASLVFFLSLGYGASLLRPLFALPLAWKILEFVIGIVMWLIAFQLLFNH